MTCDEDVHALTGQAQIQEHYMACLKDNKNDAAACQELAKSYLNCRMDRCRRCCSCQLPPSAWPSAVPCRNLMARQDLQELGLRDKATQQQAAESETDRKRQKGFVAGVR